MMQVEFETLQECIIRNVAERNEQEVADAMKALARTYEFADVLNNFEHIKKTSYEVVSALVALLSTTTELEVLRGCVYHLRAACIFHECFADKFVSSQGFAVLAKKVALVTEKLLIKAAETETVLDMLVLLIVLSQTIILHGKNFAPRAKTADLLQSIERLSKITALKPGCEVLAEGTRQTLDMFPRLSFAPEPAQRSSDEKQLQTEAVENETPIQEKVSQRDEEAVIAEPLEQKDSQTSEDIVADEPPEDIEVRTEEDLIVEDQIEEERCDLEAEEGTRADEASREEKEFQTEGEAALEERQKGVVSITETRTVQNGPSSGPAELDGGFEKLPTGSEIIIVTEKHQEPIKTANVTVEMSPDLNTVDAQPETSIFNTTCTSQGGCRGCAVFVGEHCDSRTYLQMLTNNLTICPMHRYICLAILRMTKVRGSTKSSTIAGATPVFKKPRSESPAAARVPIFKRSTYDVPFALCEDRRLRRGVFKLGVGNWETIKKKYLFAPDRTLTDLERRWYELQHQDEADNEEL